MRYKVPHIYSELSPKKGHLVTLFFYVLMFVPHLCISFWFRKNNEIRREVTLCKESKSRLWVQTKSVSTKQTYQCLFP